jgi:hypothetical protein
VKEAGGNSSDVGIADHHRNTAMITKLPDDMICLNWTPDCMFHAFSAAHFSRLASP